MRLFWLLITTGGIFIFVHDFAYRRADTAGTGDYEIYGLLTHAGADMVILTIVLAVAALAFTSSPRRAR